MTETPSDRHNRLAREFVMKVGRETTNYAEMMVVVESTILAAMLLAHKMHGVSAAAAAEMVESAVQAATERFAGERP
jgi:hypothetical protein